MSALSHKTLPLLTALCWGCSPAMGHSTDHASVAQHEAAAAENDEIAAAHQRAADAAPPCGDVPGIYEICWTRDDTPEAHQSEADHYRALARAHREAAAALTDAENAACEGLADDDRDRSPFTRNRDIAEAEVLDAGAPTDESAIPIVRVTFASVPGMTVDNMQRLVDCHLARNAALGHDVPEMDTCPLVPPGVHAKVDTADGRITVVVFAGQAEAHEVRARAEKLAAELKQ